MNLRVTVIALIKLASAAINHEIDPAPCKILSDAYKAANAAGQPLDVNIPPSVGIACLRSVPVDRERDLKLIDYIIPYISFQSTIEMLKSPPEEYLLDGVDILGGIQTIKEKLHNGQYSSQYEVMSDLRSIFAAASDSHFDYRPAILNTFEFKRPGLNLVTISKDGVALPKVYMAPDIVNEDNAADVVNIDGVPVFDFLEKEAVYQKCQDPDAQYNSLFNSLPSLATQGLGGTLITRFEVPDNHTVQFSNGTSRVTQNYVSFLPGVNFTDVDSGDAFHRKFELPPATVPNAKSEDFPVASPIQKESPVLADASFPEPVAKHSKGSIAGYFLNGPGFEDTVVLSLLRFVPIHLNEPFNFTDFVLEARDVVVKTVQKARKENRDKLLIDLSANIGGSIAMAADVYALLFPQAQFNNFGRLRATESLKLLAQADYSATRELFNIPNFPLDQNNRTLGNASDFIGPYTVKGETVTAAYQFDRTKPEIPPNFYVNAQGPGPAPIPEQPFKPENILIITDGTCASACTILTGLLTRNQGVRTVALGGRPLPYPMQAMGGVKGTLFTGFSSIHYTFKQLASFASANPQMADVFKGLQGAIPSNETAPLLPLIENSGGVNSRSDYTKEDLEGYPVHFKYEAANCKLFYTRQMALDVSETWRRAATVAWKNGSCVPGSTVNNDGTIGSRAVPFNSRVKSRAPGIKTPKPLAPATL
ncbi:hypothetical protein JDV02_005641 [Purpureocillium takamizusanense]|uniref:Tail specific protease domain-containing protein n=1 Tax=Purpureocillium takamizusanense TaxID=2060973 RepID=A0A9Q8VC23_9HYPO|nr:uncharacterized protein JDV02_005641 [Purpureocillium takamizusanense]UNI19459.1 hypothetical protein JDV02_005641 [Purpureocillium takamizusanense]